jgi:NAD(P)-dependent dehydrogenase (short-subunit alcohol dehydrogenase family)
MSSTPSVNKGTSDWLADHVVAITGGGSGLGAAVARRCRAEGARVGVLELMEHKVERMRRDLGEEAVVLQGDATKLEDQRRFRNAVVESFGQIDALIATQGIWDWNTHTEDLPLDRLDEAFWEIFDVNVKSLLLSARIFVDDLRSSLGCIVFTLSNAAFLPDGGGPLYTASKHAVLGLVRQLAFEFAPEVRVNGIAPTGVKGSDLRGPAALGMQDRSHADIPAAELADRIANLVPLRKFARPEDYTSLYVTLASARHSGVMTGQVVIADQGLSVRPL